MKVKILATGETATFNDEYAARLIEQGKAALVETVKQDNAPAEEPKTEAASTGKKK